MRIQLQKSTIPFEVVYVYDPGGTTGYARIRIDYETETIVIEEVGEFTTWTLLRQHLMEIKTRNLHTDEACVVYESFTVRQLNVNVLPVEVIGVIKFLCLEYQIHSFAQEPMHQSIKKSTFSPNGVPPVLAWFPKLSVFDSHHASAVRHGIYFITTALAKNKLWKLEFDYKSLMENFVNG